MNKVITHRNLDPNGSLRCDVAPKGFAKHRNVVNRHGIIEKGQHVRRTEVFDVAVMGISVTCCPNKSKRVLRLHQAPVRIRHARVRKSLKVSVPIIILFAGIRESIPVQSNAVRAQLDAETFWIS